MGRGRPRQFDEQKVLWSAAQLFRDRGYAATSTSALSKAMGMAEQSISNAFGTKEELFGRALEYYCAGITGGLEGLARSGSAREGIEEFFSFLVSALRGEPAGCLAVQTCMMANGEDTPGSQIASRHFRRVESHLTKAIERAVEEGESDCDDPRKIARFLTMTIHGLAVVSRTGASKRAMQDMVDVSLRALG